MLIETENLSRAVSDKVLVGDISIRVQPGEVLAVVGPSGAGKSSFLRLLNRLDEPTGGTVLLNGQDYRAIETTRIAAAHRHGHADGVSLSRNGGRKHSLRTTAAG